MPDAPWQVLEQIAAHKQRHQRQARRPLPQPIQQHPPGQAVDQDAEPGEAEAQQQQPPAPGFEIDLPQLLPLMHQGHSDEGQAGQGDPQLWFQQGSDHHVQGSSLSKLAAWAAALRSATEQPLAWLSR